MRFQSLSRDSGRLNCGRRCGWLLVEYVSIPQSGFGAFERDLDELRRCEPHGVSIPQSGFGAFEPASARGWRVRVILVSIPQSGFGAFEQ